MHIRHLPTLVTLVYAVWVKTGKTGVIGHTQDLVTTNSRKQQKCEALKKNLF